MGRQITSTTFFTTGTRVFLLEMLVQLSEMTQFLNILIFALTAAALTPAIARDQKMMKPIENLDV
jgi:hypothetical protein